MMSKKTPQRTWQGERILKDDPREFYVIGGDIVPSYELRIYAEHRLKRFSDEAEDFEKDFSSDKFSRLAKNLTERFADDMTEIQEILESDDVGDELEEIINDYKKAAKSYETFSDWNRKERERMKINHAVLRDRVSRKLRRGDDEI